MEDIPVLPGHGSRQRCKTTLARLVGDAAGFEYIIIDDDA
jgi:hypothetical protein